MKKYTVTVGISAHNEEANIYYTIQSILRQKGHSFDLRKIIVILDGCTDKTEEVVRKIQKEIALVELIVDGERKGKLARLNDLYHLNKSDFLITMDADVVFESKNDIEEMARIFRKNKEVNVVSAHEIPIKATTFVEAVNNAGHRLWDETRLWVNHGNHIHNLRGSCSMIRKSFADGVVYPDSVASDAGFLYIVSTKGNPHGFSYAYKAHIFFRSPNNLRECRILGTRAILGRRKHLASYFGSWVYDLYVIPWWPYKVRALAKTLFFHPIMTSLSIVLGLYVRLFPIWDTKSYRSTWMMIESSKKSIANPVPEYRVAHKMN